MTLDNCSPACHPRDPVAVFVEEQLLELARESGVELRFEVSRTGVSLTFDRVSVTGEGRDIAVLRLASLLLSGGRFVAALTNALNQLSAWAARGQGFEGYSLNSAGRGTF